MVSEGDRHHLHMAKNGVLIRHFDRQTLYTRLVDEIYPQGDRQRKGSCRRLAAAKVKSLLNWVNNKEEDEQQ